MKLAILLAALITVAACAPIVDNRSEPERAATQTARAMLIPPLPHTLKVWVLPQPTVNYVPTVTPAP